MPHDSLGEFEKLLMMAVLQLGEDAYGAGIIEELERRTGRTAAPGAVYVCLGRLEKKLMVVSRLGESSPARGGRPKRFYSVTRDGIEALRRARAEWRAMADGLDPILEADR